MTTNERRQRRCARQRECPPRVAQNYPHLPSVALPGMGGTLATTILPDHKRGLANGWSAPAPTVPAPHSQSQYYQALPVTVRAPLGHQRLSWDTLRAELAESSKAKGELTALARESHEVLRWAHVDSASAPATTMKTILIGAPPETKVAPAPVRFEAVAAGGLHGLRNFARLGRVYNAASPKPVDNTPPREVFFAYCAGHTAHRPLILVRAEVPDTAQVDRFVDAKSGAERFCLDRWRPREYAEVAEHHAAVWNLKWTSGEAAAATAIGKHVIGVGEEATTQIVFSEGWIKHTVKGLNNGFRTPEAALADGRRATGRSLY